MVEVYISWTIFSAISDTNEHLHIMILCNNNASYSLRWWVVPTRLRSRWMRWHAGTEGDFVVEFWRGSLQVEVIR
jgi:hypothetical protein